ncbi:uncharacterized protein [Arachis hypogaea]|uniref:uncharacterized protein n=1 Tax=Arachis hypogaea TaxID=3818 RepID=UPI003B220DB1
MRELPQWRSCRVSAVTSLHAAAVLLAAASPLEEEGSPVLSLTAADVLRRSCRRRCCRRRRKLQLCVSDHREWFYEQLATASYGIYTFCAQGSMYYSIGGFHPDQGTWPHFLQLYIYDTEHELQNRMLENTQLHEDLQECSLVIRERPANQPQYSLPTASQVAAIIVGNDIETMVHGQDVKVQTHAGKLRWVRQRQPKLRVELYQGLQDALHTGETNAENVGRRTILPSSFVGSRRDMTQRYEDGIAIVLKEGKPDIFFTMTCNPSWSEIASKLSPTQISHDRPDLTTRIFRAKFEQLKEDVITKGVLEKMVVPYNPWLLLKYDCHINVEIYSSIKSIKYLYMYCYKGPDHVAMEVHKSSYYDEMKQFIDARWIAALEACWRIFKFNFYRMYPSVERLQVHLPNQHQVSFYEHQTISKIVNDEYFSRTMLTKFFALNRANDQQSRHLLYRKIPEYYSWHSKEKEWHRRRGPTGWDDLLTVNGVQYSSFKQSTQHRGLCKKIVDEFLSYMVDDYPSTSTTTCHGLTNRLLRDLNDILLQREKNIAQYDLPALTSDNNNDNLMPRIIQEEMSIEVPREDLCSIERLNYDQFVAFRCIMDTIDQRKSGVFFVDGPGRTGIAATLLSGGRTTHSRFKIPINAEPSSMCNISKQSDFAKLIRQTTTIIWDEASMANKEIMESLDRTLRDILENNNPFGGKVMVMGGDFRQVLHVVPKGSKSQMILASIVKSHLWAFTEILHLRQNMRSLNDNDFAKYLMRIWDGIEPTICEDLVQIEAHMVIPWEGEASLHKLIEEIFPNLQSHGWDASYMVERAILTPKNHDMQQLNDIVINQFLGDERILASFDEVEGDTNKLYQQEYLNSISTAGLPPHMLKVKKGAPLMLLRNIDPKAGLCNGIRLLCRGTFQNMLDVKILTRHHSGQRAFLSRIKHKTTENSGLPFVLIRKQFSVRLSFVLTINKSQGQTIPKVGIYLPKRVFSDDQLYVALSRSVS